MFTEVTIPLIMANHIPAENSVCKLKRKPTSKENIMMLMYIKWGYQPPVQHWYKKKKEVNFMLKDTAALYSRPST